MRKSKALLSLPAKVAPYSEEHGEPVHVMLHADDFRDLATQAAGLIKEKPERCSFALVVHDSRPDVSELQVMGKTHRVTVGPMAAPMLPEDGPLSRERGYPLDELLAHIDLAEDSTAYPVVIDVAGYRRPDEPRRRKHETDEDFAERIEAYDAWKANAARVVGVRTVRSEIPPQFWTVSDMRSVIEQIFAMMPPGEREDSIYSHMDFRVHLDPEPYAQWKNSRRPRFSWRMSLMRGDFLATMRLPIIPVTAVATLATEGHASISLKADFARLRAKAEHRRLTRELVGA